MAKATNEARAKKDQGKDEDITKNKVCIFQSMESKEIEKKCTSMFQQRM